MSNKIIKVGVAVVGPTGSVGREFMKLLQSRRGHLRRLGLDVRVTGALRSRGSVTSAQRNGKHLRRVDWEGPGLPHESDATWLMNAGGGCERAVLVDCSTRPDGDLLYQLAMQNGYDGVVTVNKRSLVVPISRYRKLLRTARATNTRLLTGATIGPGLYTPRELQDLILRGDKFQKVEVVLGGSIAFILDTFQKAKKEKFSAVVRQAQTLGYLDPPNPFVDLSGEDVAWKLLLILRGLRPKLRRGANLSDMQVTPVIKTPNNFKRLGFDEAMRVIESHDKAMDEMRRRAGRNRLRFVGVVTPDGRASAKLQVVKKGHPAFDLEGPTNMVSIVDEGGRRKTIIGVGAGPDITALTAFRDFVEACGIAPEAALA